MTRISKIGTVAASIVWLGMLAGCSGGGDPRAASAATAAAPVKISEAARQEAQQTFKSRCSVCHGEAGRGDGPAATGLTPSPRNHHDQAWQAQVTDDQIEKTIVYGGAAVGKSPAMVANPDLGSKPEVVAALREIVRAFGKQQ
jgi:mono/diheme cytochrome c family protein